jgi:hypothetical protein
MLEKQIKRRMEVIDEYLLRTFKKMFRKNKNGIAHD